MPITALLLAAAVSAPPLKTVIDQATEAKRPILLDVYTVWCKPCQRMDEAVFPHPLVQAALRDWVFQKYDAEAGEGLAVGARFEVSSYPTLLVLSPDGVEVTRLNAQDPAGLAQALNRIAALARVIVPEPAVLAAVKDPLVLMAAAKRAAPAERLALYKRALEADSTGAAGIGAEALLAVTKAELADETNKRHSTALVNLLRRFPGSPQALAALSGLASLPAEVRPPHDRLAPLVMALATSRPGKAVCDLNDSVYVLLSFDAPLALEVALRLEMKCDSAGVLDTVAEAQFQNGNRELAVELEQRALKASPDDTGLQQNLARFQTGAPAPSSDTQFTNPLEVTPSFRFPPPDASSMLVRSIGRAAGEACESAPHTRTHYTARLHKEKNRNRAVLLDPEASPKLKACLEKVIPTIPEVAQVDDDSEIYVSFRAATKPQK